MTNMTAYEGETKRIFCEITGDPLPQYSWYRNDVAIAVIEQQDSRYNAKPMTWGSRYALAVCVRTRTYVWCDVMRMHFAYVVDLSVFGQESAVWGRERIIQR